jgi:hypothetical protein
MKKSMGFIVVSGAILLGLLRMVNIGLQDTSSAKRAIEIRGFRDVRNVQRHLLGHYVYGCDSEEVAFTAQAIQGGRQVTVIVCTVTSPKGYAVRVVSR